MTESELTELVKSLLPNEQSLPTTQAWLDEVLKYNPQLIAEMDSYMMTTYINDVAEAKKQLKQYNKQMGKPKQGGYTVKSTNHKTEEAAGQKVFKGKLNKKKKS